MSEDRERAEALYGKLFGPRLTEGVETLDSWRLKNEKLVKRYIETEFARVRAENEELVAAVRGIVDEMNEAIESHEDCAVLVGIADYKEIRDALAALVEGVGK